MRNSPSHPVNNQPANHPLANPLEYVFDQASRALGYMDHIAVGNTYPHARSLKPAVASGTIDIRKHFASDLDGGLLRVDSLPSGETIEIAASIIKRSRVAQAGARVIIAADKPGSSSEGVPYFYTDVGLVRAIDPATFAEVADGADAALSELPFYDVTLKWPDAPSIAVSFNVSRSKQKGAGGREQLQADLLSSITEGLALAADKILLAAIAANNPAPFTFGAAAVRNLAFENLRALIGTNGAGATVNPDGNLRAGGIAAELTAGTAGTYVGAFARAAVAIRPELHLHVTRMDLDGNMNCTLFASIQGLVPDPSTFWEVSGS